MERSLAPESWHDLPLRNEWEELLDQSDNIHAIYQSPKWLDHVRATGAYERLSLAVARSEAGRLVGAVPLCAARGSLPFHVGGRSFARIPLQQVWLMGSEPLVPADDGAYESLFRAVDGAFRDSQCITLSSVPRSSSLWQYLRSSTFVRRHFLLYAVDGACNYHMIPLPLSFQDYLAQFRRKKSYNLKRQLRLLRDRCRGELALHRIERENNVALWSDAYDALAGPKRNVAGSPAAVEKARERRQLVDLAGRGLLRSYVLTSRGQYIGQISGCQYGSVYSVTSMDHNREFAAFSPGTATLYLAIEDLLAHRPVTLIDMGFGEPRHRHSTQVVLKYSRVILFRKSFVNSLYRGSHAAFRSGVLFLRRAREWIGSGLRS